MSHVLYRLGRFAARRPWTMIGLWVAVSAVVVTASVAYGREMEDSFEVPGVDSQIAIDLLAEAGNEQAGLTAQVVVAPTEPGVSFFDTPTALDDLAEVRSAVAALPNVVGAGDPAEALIVGREAALASGSVSPDGRVALINLQYPVADEVTIDDVERLEARLAELRDETSLRIESRGELHTTFAADNTGTAEMIGVLAAVVILLVAFGSLIAMGLPIGIAVFGLALSVTAMSLMNHLIEIPAWVPALGAMIGLGVGIDYALFLVTRHREQLAAGYSLEESIGRAVATAGQAVLFAGGTVVIAILGLAMAGIPFLTAAGVAISMIVAVMVLASVSLLPAFLGLAGDRINGIVASRRKVIAGGGAAGVSPRWERWGRHVSSHAWVYAIGVTGLLIAMTAPLLWLQLGVPDDGTLPERDSRRQAYDLVAEGFGPGVNGPLLIALDLSAIDAQGRTSVADDVVAPLAVAVGADPGVVMVTPPAIDGEAGVATMVAVPTTSPQDDVTLATVQRLRADVFPEVLDGTGATAHVGGQTASQADIAERLNARLPLFVTAVVVLSFLLLMVLFRSILVPLKAALLNLLSIGAGYGVLVAVFQWGWGANLIGLETTVPITSFIPIFMFAVLFGLSMDYEVFLLSRIREEYTSSGDNEAAVVRGLAGTARVITSAALIMISVFSGFILSGDPSYKMWGLGLATAIFVDATIVRIVLVPATMKLMGDANWWLPGWLDRILPTVDIEGGEFGAAPDGNADAAIDAGGAVDVAVAPAGAQPDDRGAEIDEAALVS